MSTRSLYAEGSYYSYYQSFLNTYCILPDGSVGYPGDPGTGVGTPSFLGYLVGSATSAAAFPGAGPGHGLPHGPLVVQYRRYIVNNAEYYLPPNPPGIDGYPSGWYFYESSSSISDVITVSCNPTFVTDPTNGLVYVSLYSFDYPGTTDTLAHGTVAYTENWFPPGGPLQFDYNGGDDSLWNLLGVQPSTISGPTGFDSQLNDYMAGFYGGRIGWVVNSKYALGGSSGSVYGSQPYPCFDTSGTWYTTLTTVSVVNGTTTTTVGNGAHLPYGYDTFDQVLSAYPTFEYVPVAGYTLTSQTATQRVWTSGENSITMTLSGEIDPSTLLNNTYEPPDNNYSSPLADQLFDLGQVYIYGYGVENSPSMTGLNIFETSVVVKVSTTGYYYPVSTTTNSNTTETFKALVAKSDGTWELRTVTASGPTPVITESGEILMAIGGGCTPPSVDFLWDYGGEFGLLLSATI